MLTEALAAAAAAGGTAVVQAAGTDVWAAVRGRIAALLGRNDQERQNSVLARLDRTLAEIETTGGFDGSQRMQLAASWRVRFEDFLDELPPEAQDEAAAHLQQIASLSSLGNSSATAAQQGLAVGRDIHVQADNGSVAGGVLNVEGGLHVGNPHQPGAARG